CGAGYSRQLVPGVQFMASAIVKAASERPGNPRAIFGFERPARGYSATARAPGLFALRRWLQTVVVAARTPRQGSSLLGLTAGRFQGRDCSAELLRKRGPVWQAPRPGSHALGPDWDPS